MIIKDYKTKIEDNENTDRNLKTDNRQEEKEDDKKITIPWFLI